LNCVRAYIDQTSRLIDDEKKKSKWFFYRCFGVDSSFLNSFWLLVIVMKWNVNALKHFISMHNMHPSLWFFSKEFFLKEGSKGPKVKRIDSSATFSYAADDGISYFFLQKVTCSCSCSILILIT